MHLSFWATLKKAVLRLERSHSMPQPDELPDSEIQERPTEMIDGVVYPQTIGTPSHASVIGNLHFLLRSYFNGKTCQPFTGELDVMLDEQNTFRPDISVVCDSTRFTEQGYSGAPTLVIEVLSPRTAKVDKGRKFLAYQRHGVKEYWIVDADSESVEQFVLENGVFALKSIHVNTSFQASSEETHEQINFTNKFTSAVFENLTLSLPDIFSYMF
jgi:Uma2 family endonuclease